MFLSLIKNRALIFELSRREVTGRYKGSFLGFFWSLITPLIMLLVYTFVFGFVFKSRWRNGSTDTYEYALVMFAGILVHGLISECLQRAPTLIVGNANYVKKVVFPLEILTWVTMVGIFFWQGYLPWSAFLLPLILLPYLLLISGLVWMVSAFGVYLRDLGQVMGILSSLLMFLAPVFYSADSIAQPMRSLLYLNPITFILEQVRAAMIWGNDINWIGLSEYLIAGYGIAIAGFYCFQKTRKGFADVL
jgi:lipopolysaccharide transport system permease protein